MVYFVIRAHKTNEVFAKSEGPGCVFSSRFGCYVFAHKQTRQDQIKYWHIWVRSVWFYALSSSQTAMWDKMKHNQIENTILIKSELYVKCCNAEPKNRFFAQHKNQAAKRKSHVFLAGYVPINFANFMMWTQRSRSFEYKIWIWISNDKNWRRSIAIPCIAYCALLSLHVLLASA